MIVVVIVVVVVVGKVGRSLLEWVADPRSGGYRSELSRQDAFLPFFDLDFAFLLQQRSNCPPVMQLDARLEVQLTSFGLVALGSLLGLVPGKSGSHEGTSTDIGARQGGWYLGK